jgi:hypothetical protein
MAPLLTILTDPMPIGRRLVPEGGRRIARAARDLVVRKRSWHQHRQYRGHFAVTRSLVEGLEEIDASFNYNPVRASDLGRTVLAISGVETVRQAIELKRAGLIERLLVGPNIVVFASDENSIIASPEIDEVVLPCQLSIDLYLEDCPSLADHVSVWPAGVDTSFWSSDGSVRDQVLIFEKQAKGPVGPVEPYADYLQSLGENPKVIRYGEYDHELLLRELRRSKVMVGFVTDESQGLAWAEAWSTEVPTLIWKNDTNVYRGRRYNCSTAPYLSSQTGLFFDDLADFRVKFDEWKQAPDVFCPRDWVLKHMSDRVCAELLYSKVLGV